MAKCQGLTKSGTPCSRNAVQDGFCGQHLPEQTPEETNLHPGLNDRMMSHQRNPVCPRCGAHPTVCTLRRGAYSAHRCRVCGSRWDNGGAG